MNLATPVLLAAAGLVLVDCAATPESIAGVYVSTTTYDPLSCSDLAAETARVNAALSQVSSQQSAAHGGDIVGWIVIGVPVSTMSGGDVSQQVANLKGQQEALRLAVVRKHCG